MTSHLPELGVPSDGSRDLLTYLVTWSTNMGRGGYHGTRYVNGFRAPSDGTPSSIILRHIEVSNHNSLEIHGQGQPDHTRRPKSPSKG